MQLRLLLLTLLAAGTTLLPAQRNCGSMDYLEQQLQRDPGRQLQLEQLERFTEQYDARNEKALSGGILTIPVIVHVVYRMSTENISDAQINSQIRVLNEDFRRLNADRTNTPADFRSVATDSEIEFCLTQVNRVATTRTSFGTNDAVKSASTGGADAINPQQSLNIWVCVIGGSILGYAQFPGGPSATDGVVLDYRYVGTTGTAQAPFNLGRTATHEVGHWLNLRHIWGDGGCSVDDFVGDTPTAGGPNYTGGACTYPGPNSCMPKGKNSGADLPDMFQNYMDYSDDACMNLFTLGQKDRMWAAVSAARPELLSSACDGTTPPTTDPSPEPPTADCAAPAGLNAQRTNRDRSVSFSWNAASGASSYEIEVYVGSSLYASGTVSGTGATLNVDRRTTYTWRVRSNCSSSTSDWTNGGSFREAARTASALAQEMSVYPNPSNLSEVTVGWNLQPATTLATTGVLAEATASPQIRIEVRDMTGRMLRQLSVADSGQATLPVGDLAPGVYLVHVRDTEGYAVSSRFVKL
ncbi:M43 family zinc metalloprotease [Neolewinella sp.]|uniref:M43 family zinc metalloprotease n=1 Tax=Neolewinella sp. TaxID=2993543 RepID=UPI003B51E2E6